MLGSFGDAGSDDDDDDASACGGFFELEMVMLEIFDDFVNHSVFFSWDRDGRASGAANK
jgi:hypothetical protein